MQDAGRTKLTDQQRAAIETRDVSIALSAGAGCGKTFVLTRRFLSHLEPGPHAASLTELVAITFTDRAAREMRDRIRSVCRERLQACDAEQVPHWRKVLYDLDAARITTIHSFCASLLRSHAVEAGLDPRFEVADAAQTEALVQRSARNTLHRLLEQENEDAFRFVLLFGLERSRELLAGLIGQRFRTTRATLAGVSSKKCAAIWLKRWQEEFQPQFVQEFYESPICELTRKWLQQNSPRAGTMIADRCRSVRRLLGDRLAAMADSLTWLGKLREAAMIKGGKREDWVNPEHHVTLRDLWVDLRKDIDKVSKAIEFDQDKLQVAAELTEQTSRLAIAAIDDYERQKQEQGGLDFDDLLLKTRDLLRDHPDVPRRLARDIQLLMVDEFQDTDLVQAEIIRRIAGPALKSGKLFLVGDAQQSIYRFRRADPKVFQQLRQEIPERGRLPLKKNFRSVPGVLDFVNHLFAKKLGEDFQELTPSEEHQVSEPERKALGPVIEFLWATRDVQPNPNPPAEPSAEELRRREADWIALRIAQLLADPTPSIREKGPDGQPRLRPVSRGDIVLLFRTLGDVAVYEESLTRQGIDYYLVGGKSFYAQQEVFDLLNLCQWLDDPADEIPLVGCLRSPFFNLSDDAIHTLRLSADTLTQALEKGPPDGVSDFDRQRIRFAGAVLTELRQSKDRLPPSELLRTAVERTGYDAALLHEFLGERKVANLDKLIRQAAEFDDAEHFTLSDYVQQLQRSVRDQTDEALAVTLEEAGDVVRLMTIHQSKGLEFPVVFVADMNRDMRSRPSSVVMHQDWGVLAKPPDDFEEEYEHLGLRIHQQEEKAAEEQELLRVLYVALTRAADRLILSAGMTQDFDGHSLWIALLSEYFHLESGLPKTDALLGSHLGGGAGRRRIPEIKCHPSPPQATAKKDSTPRRTPLDQLPELLSQAAPEDFPESVRLVPPSKDWLGMISVSRLEEMVLGERAVHEFEPEDVEDRPRVAADVLGNVVHRALQLIDLRDPNRWPDVLADCLRNEPLATADLALAARELIERFLAAPLAAQLASAETLHREIDFVLSWPPNATAKPQALVTGQIDVLFRSRDGGWNLLDYKTGLFPASVPDAELLAPYAVQLGIYALAAERYLNQPLASMGIIALRPAVRLLRLDWTDAKRDEVLRLVADGLAKPRLATAVF